MPTIVLIAALVLNALVAGLYFAFTTAVMPGLARTDDRSYVTSMQRIDQSIMNPWFLTAFTGALVIPIIAVLLHLDDDARARVPWIIAGAALYGVTVVITSVVNVPLNRRLAEAGVVSDRSAPAVRTFYHQRWTRFNNSRTVLSTAAVIALSVALSQPVG